jgi:O-antigen ligase
VGIVGLMLIFLLDKRQRVTLGLYGVGLLVFAAMLTQTSLGATFTDYLDRTFGGDVSLDKRTTGRAEQWAAFPKILEASPLWGHGPGMGRQVGAEYAGRYLALHSLYLQVGSELGLLGLGLIALFFWFLVRRGLYYYRTFDEPVPLIGSVAFAVVGLSVPAIDLTSALLLSLGMVRLRGQVYRVIPAAPPAYQVPAAPRPWRPPAREGEETA